MIELLILYVLAKNTFTMYGISKEIKKEFSVLTIPSLGTIKPALQRLEKRSCIKTQKTMSSGGRPSTFYSITNEGRLELKELILAEPLENPIQFLPTSRIKVVCSEHLETKERVELFKLLKIKCEKIILDISKKENQEFYYKMILENLVCEYKNFVSLLEALSRAGNN